MKYQRICDIRPLFARGPVPGIFRAMLRTRTKGKNGSALLAACLAAVPVFWAAEASSDSKVPPAWVRTRPPAELQIERSKEERGVNPCMTEDPGFSGYSTWDRAPAMGQMIVPESLTKSSATFDVVFHFHGHEAARKEWVRKVDRVVLVGIDLGNGSRAYQEPFAVPGVFESLVQSVERGVRKRLDNPNIRVGKIGLTAWSAGYGAVVKILGTAYGQKRVDSVALLDGLHTSYVNGQLDTARLEPVVSFAERAMRGERAFYMSHSSISPPGYASTTETGNYLIWRLGGRPEKPPAPRSFPLGLELISTYSKGEFTVRGFRGGGKLDHCAHFGVLGDVVRGRFLPRWRSLS